MFRRIRSMSRRTGAVMLAIAIVFGGIAVGIGFASETAYADGEKYSPVTRTEFGAAGDFTFVSYADTEVGVHHAGNILCGGSLTGSTNVGTQLVNGEIALPSIVTLGQWSTSVYPENGGAAYYVDIMGEAVGNYVAVKVGEKFVDMDALYGVLDAISLKYIGYRAGAFNPENKNGMTIDLSVFRNVKDICIKNEENGTETYVFDITDLVKSFEGEDSYGSDAYQLNINNVRKNTKVIINIDAEELAEKSTLNLFKVRVNGKLTGDNGQVAPEFAENIIWNVFFPTTSDENKTINLNVTEGVGYYLAPNANVTASNCNGAIFANSIKAVGECHSFALSFFEEPEESSSDDVTETETTEPESTEPETESTEPETESTEPETESTEPETETTEPETESTEPETNTTEPETETTEPETNTTEPETETTEPETNTTEPETETTEPETNTTEPETETTEPETPVPSVPETSEEATTPVVPETPEETTIEIITRTVEVEGDEDVTPEEPTSRPRRRGEVEADTGDNSHADLFKIIFGISGVCFAGLGIYGLTKKR